MSTASIGIGVGELVSCNNGGTIYMTERNRRRFLRSVNVTDLEGDVFYRNVRLSVLSDDECLLAGHDSQLVLLHE